MQRIISPHHSNEQDWSVCANGQRNKGAVKGAVSDFFAPLGLQVVVTYKESFWHTWMVRKPKASPANSTASGQH